MRAMKRLSFVLVLFCIANISVFGQTSEKNTLKSDPNTPIFEIKNDLGQTVFAVYPGGVHIFVDDTQLKTTGGGFKVGRISTEKSTLGDIFTVVPGEVNVYIDNPLKATGAGFKVGRVGTEKANGSAANFLSVTPDSTKVNISETGVGGFSVGKLGQTEDVDFLNLTPDNYFIGHNVAKGITTGTKNSVLGYNAGYSLKTGYSNIFVGDSSGYSNSGGHDNIFLGNHAGSKSNGNENIFIGNEAGFNNTSSVRNVFIGFEAGHENTTSHYNVYVGNGAGRNGTGQQNTIIGALAANKNNFGNGNVALGYVAGRDMVASNNNVLLGMGAGYLNTGDIGGNVFIGYYAGENLSTQDNRLAISNRTKSAPLIYGEFDNERVVIKGTNPNGFNFFVNGTSGGTSDFAVFSDMRLKTNIITIPSAMEKVLQLRGVSFDWKNTESFDNKTHIGFIAQEVEKIIPEVVAINNDKYTIQYAPLTALLVEAMKEQQKEIESLKQKVDEIDALKAEIQELKSLIKSVTNEKEEFKPDK